MAWIAPKVDWDSDNVVAHTDLNRIEGNTDSNHRRFEVSSNVHTAGTIATGSFNQEITVGFTVEDGIKLVLKNARYRFSNSDIRLRLRYDIGGGLVTAWTSSSNVGDDEPDTTVYSNTTGLPVPGFYQIEAYNSAGAGRAVALADGWSITLEKEAV